MIKALIWAIISLLMLFVMTSGISIQLKPFRIDITYPYFGLGIVLTAIGLTLCIGSAYYYGISNNQYKDGYKKGFHAGVEYVIEFAKQKKNDLSLATTEKGYTLQNGIQVPDRTEWHSLIFWKGLAEVVEKYVRKGSQIYIEGKIKTRQYEDRTGSKRYVTEIFVDKLELLGSRLAQQEASLQSKLYQPEQSREDLPF